MVPSILNLKGILRIFNLSIDLDVFRTLLIVPSILNLLRCQNLGQANLAPYTAAISQWWEGRRISEDPMCLQGHASSKHSRSCLSVRVRACVHVCMCVCLSKAHSKTKHSRPFRHTTRQSSGSDSYIRKGADDAER